eukprot:gene5336-8149_t
MAGTPGEGAALAGPQPPRKELLQLHNDLLKAQRDKLRKRYDGYTQARVRAKVVVSPQKGTGNGDAASVLSTAVSTAVSRWDEATVEDCWAFIRKPHRPWDSAQKGMDITDVCPQWKRPRSEAPASFAGDNRSDVTSVTSKARSTASHTPRRAADAATVPDLDLTIGSVASGMTAASIQTAPVHSRAKPPPKRVGSVCNGSALRLVRDKRRESADASIRQPGSADQGVGLGVMGSNFSSSTVSGPPSGVSGIRPK